MWAFESVICHLLFVIGKACALPSARLIPHREIQLPPSGGRAMLGKERFFMRTVKIAGLILAGLLAVSSTAFAGGFGGGGHSGGGGFGGRQWGGAAATLAAAGLVAAAILPAVDTSAVADASVQRDISPLVTLQEATMGTLTTMGTPVTMDRTITGVMDVGTAGPMLIGVIPSGSMTTVITMILLPITTILTPTLTTKSRRTAPQRSPGQLWLRRKN